MPPDPGIPASRRGPDPLALPVGLADLATSVLAVVVVAFLLIAPASDAKMPDDGPALTARRPLDADGLVDVLAATRRTGGALVIELLDDGIRLRGPGGRITRPADAATLRMAIGGSREIAVAVFSNRHDRLLRAALAGNPADLREISVPVSLRRPDGSDWSDGFLDLAATAGGRDAFRAGLAALLGGGPAREGAGAALRSPGGSLAADLMASLRTAALLAGIAATVFVLWRIERRMSRP